MDGWMDGWMDVCNVCGCTHIVIFFQSVLIDNFAPGFSLFSPGSGRERTTSERACAVLCAFLCAFLSVLVATVAVVGTQQ